MEQARADYIRRNWPGICPWCRAWYGRNMWQPWHWKHEECSTVREPVDGLDLPNVITMCRVCGDLYAYGGEHDCPGEWIDDDDGWDDDLG